MLLTIKELKALAIKFGHGIDTEVHDFVLRVEAEIQTECEKTDQQTKNSDGNNVSSGFSVDSPA